MICKYRQLADLLRGDIAKGALSTGDMMPTEAQIGTRFGVSRITVRSALQELEAGGLISREQGKGTFVAQQRPVTNKPSEDLLHILFLLIDVSPEADYNYREIVTTERSLSERGIPFSWAVLTSEDLVRGRFPAILEKGICQGVIVDGHVTDAHMALGERFGLKILAVGNHKLELSQAQVRARTDQACRTLVSTLAGDEHRKVVLAVEPLRLSNTSEMQAGYVAGLEDIGQVEQLVYLCPGDLPPKGLLALLHAQPQTTALFTTDTIYAQIREGLNLRNGDPMPFPTCVMAPRPLSPAPHGPVHQLCFKSKQVQTLAVERLLDLIEGRCETVYEELDLEHLPPGGGDK